MRVKLVRKDLDKGIALIIGRRVGSGFRTNETVLHTAQSLSLTPYYIDNINLSLVNLPTTTTIYLCGHGKDGKIAGRESKEIAEILVSRGYTGNQKIFLTACYSKGNIDQALSRELCGLLNREVQVISETESPSIIIRNDDDSVDLYSVKEARKIDTLIKLFNGSRYILSGVNTIDYTEEAKVPEDYVWAINESRKKVNKKLK